MNTTTVPLQFHPRRPAAPARLARLGEWMRRHRNTIVGLQWIVLLAYGVLVVTPAFLPLPRTGDHIWTNLTLAAQFVFWGIWWPFVLLSMMLMGRVWCGVLCPEGFVSEQVSRFGLGRPVPRWLKWGGWPFVAFVLTTVYGQLASVYEYPKAALLVLGGSTIAAIAIGLVYGKGKRVWCRHLCPVSGVFGLLSRLAPVHFRTDREAWDTHPRGPVAPVDCAPLVDLRRMESAAPCHMCGRCSGHRDAITLSARLPGSEVARLREEDTQPWEVRLLLFGLIGTAVGAFQWSASPWFIHGKQAAAEWLVEHDHFALLEDNAPWWLLTHYPEANDVFTWLDGLMILGYIGATAVLIGVALQLTLALAARCSGGVLSARRLAYALIPLAGAGVFLGLSALTVTLLSAEGIAIPGLAGIRDGLLAIAAAGALALAVEQSAPLPPLRRAATLLAFLLPVTVCVLPWFFMFHIW